MFFHVKQITVVDRIRRGVKVARLINRRSDFAARR